MPSRVPFLLPWLVAVAGALGAWLMVGAGFANYDTMYALVWGSDLAHGRLPDYDVPVAPTPHPLSNLLGLVLAPLGDGAETAWVVLGFLALGALGGLTYALGARWFGPAAGVIAAVIILTREPVLSFGVRAYLDIPYLVLVLAALWREARTPRAGLPVLVLLMLAGLLRPEAWLFSAAYLGWFLLGRDASWRRLTALGVVAAAAPALWMLADLVVTGNALYSLVGTQDNAEVLQRRTGLAAVPVTAPRRLGEILREPVLLGAALGGLLSLGLLRARVALPVAAGVAAMVAFCVLAAAGLPILGRYLLLPATLLAIFCAGAVTGWRLIPVGHPWRRRWQAAAALTVIALVAFIPAQVARIDRLESNMNAQEEIHDDLRDVTRAPVFTAGCGHVGVPNHRLVPSLALWLDRRPSEIVSAQLTELRSGIYVQPATSRVERMFTLDKNDPRLLTAEVPDGFREVARNASWVVHASC
jgi:hypothetical protein